MHDVREISYLYIATANGLSNGNNGRKRLITVQNPIWHKMLRGIPSFSRIAWFLEQQGRFVVESLNISAGLHAHDALDVPFAAAFCSRAFFSCFVNDLVSSHSLQAL